MSDIQPNQDEARTPTGELKPTTPTDTTPPPAEQKKETLLTEDDKKDDKAPTGAPEKYEAYKLPENFTMDEAQMTEVNTMFKDLNLSQNQAQQLIDYYAKQSQSAAQAQMDLYNNQRKEWQDAVKADPEIGTKLPQVKTDINRLLDSMGDPKLANEFKQAMDLTGAGDNPSFIKAFWKIAQKYSEGKPVSGTPAKPTARPSAAQSLYPNHP
jgi:hypothetical protein